MQVTELFDKPLSFESTLHRIAAPAGSPKSSNAHNSHSIRFIVFRQPFCKDNRFSESAAGYLPSVQSSVRNGPAGSPVPFVRLQTGLFAQA